MYTFTVFTLVLNLLPNFYVNLNFNQRQTSMLKISHLWILNILNIVNRIFACCTGLTLICIQISCLFRSDQPPIGCNEKKEGHNMMQPRFKASSTVSLLPSCVMFSSSKIKKVLVYLSTFTIKAWKQYLWTINDQIIWLNYFNDYLDFICYTSSNERISE